MVAGTYAFTAYTGIERPTKDFDIMTAHEDYPALLKAATEAGYRTELLDPNWIAKIYQDRESEPFVDIVFSERNGLHRVSSSWFPHTRTGKVLEREVALMPVEEMIRSKAYIQFKDKYDGADVIHLILLYGKSLDWQFLLTSMNPHWQLLFAHILNFCFVYPSERDAIPQWVINELVSRTQREFSTAPPEEKISRGLLISSQYSVGIEKWGFKPVHKLK